MNHLKIYESFGYKNLIQYTYKVQELFYKYSQPQSNEKIELSELITELRNIESIERKSGDYSAEEGLWFKFFSGDTLSTTIRDIETDLNLPITHGNHKLMLDRLQMTSELSNEMSIYFS